MITAHSQDGRHVLGPRSGRRGGYEIVYDGRLRRRRFVWTLKTDAIETDDIHRQLHRAIMAADVLHTLYAGLRSAEIEFEVDREDTGAG